MNSKQFNGDSFTHSIFTRALLQDHRYEAAVQFMNTQMAKTSIFRQNRFWDLLIQSICNHGKDPERALSLLQHCLRVDGILPSPFTYLSLIRSFSSQGKMDRAIEVLEMMTDEKTKSPFHNFICSSVISGFVKIGKPELAVGFYENAAKSDALHPNIVTYTALLTAYYRLGRIDALYELVSKLDKDVLAFDVVFYSSWIYEYFREGILKEAFQKHKEMVERKIHMDTISYTILIDGLSKEGFVEKAVGFVSKMKKEGLKPNLVTYTAIMLGFCKKGKLEEAFRVFKMVEDIGFEVDEIIYATLIDGFCRRGDFNSSFHLLGDMEKKGIPPGIVTYNTVINGLCKAGRTSEADEVSKGILGDVITYSTLLHGYIEEDNAMGMLETKRRLEAAGVCPDVIMCNILIKALLIVGLFEDAIAIYKRMPEMNLPPDSVTYCTMIDGYCKVGKLDVALEVFDEFRNTSISSVACYNCIIHGLCKKGMIDMAVEVFIELAEKDLPFDEGMHMMLLKAIFKSKSAEGVLNLVRRIEILEPEIFDIACNHAISFLYKRGFFEAASYVYLVMRRKGSVATSRSYQCILGALIHESKMWLTRPILSTFIKIFGIVRPEVSRILVHNLCIEDVNEALKFLGKTKGFVTFPVTILEKLTKDGRALDAYKLVMGSKDNLPLMDVVDYSIVVDGLCKGGHINEALDLCYFVRKKGITLSIITYNSVINGLCHQGCLVQAFRLFDSLEKVDMVPSEITYATLIDNLCKEGFLLDARKLFERMVVKGYKPNTRVYNSLINGHCRLGQMQEALKLLLDLEVNCLKPDEFTVSAVINGCCHDGDMEEALAFFFEFKRKGVLPDFLGFIFLVRGLCSKGRMEESRSIIREMLQTQSVIDLLSKVETKVKTESIEHLLTFFCEQGRIQEATTVLNEVASMFFPLGGFGADSGRKNFRSRCLISTYESDLDFEACSEVEVEKVVKYYGYIDKHSQPNDFDSYYALIASLCSRGELHKANKLAKVLSESVGGCL